VEEARFESSVPLWLGAFTRSKTSMSGPVGVGGFEEGEFEGDGPLEKVAAQILLRGADAVQLRAQEIDEAAKPRIVVQRDPLGVHEIDRQRLRRAGGPVEIEPFGHDEDRKRRDRCPDRELEPELSLRRRLALNHKHDGLRLTCNRALSCALTVTFSLTDRNIRL